jgi:hypothetical protein
MIYDKDFICMNGKKKKKRYFFSFFILFIIAFISFVFILLSINRVLKKKENKGLIRS